MCVLRQTQATPAAGPTHLGYDESMPLVERAFLRLLDEITRRLTDEDSPGIDDEFSLSEFLDRYGMRLGQLGTLLNTLGPIADASRQMGDGTP